MLIYRESNRTSKKREPTRSICRESTRLMQRCRRDPNRYISENKDAVQVSKARAKNDFDAVSRTFLLEISYKIT